jgi:hypothetical protein
MFNHENYVFVKVTKRTLICEVKKIINEVVFGCEKNL